MNQGPFCTKSNLVAALHLSGRAVHNYTLMRLYIVLDNLSKTVLLIDEDQEMDLLHAPFKGTTLFIEELAKLQKANTSVLMLELQLQKRCLTKKRGAEDSHDRSVLSATSTRPDQK